MDVRRAAAMNEQMMREQYEMPYAVETHQRNMAGEMEARRMVTSRAMNGSSGEMGYGHLQVGAAVRCKLDPDDFESTTTQLSSNSDC